MEFETKDLSKLDTLAFAISNYIAHSLPNGKLYKNTIANFATFVSPYVSQVGSAAYIPVSGGELPSPANDIAFTIVGKKTLTQTVGDDVVATGDLNILGWDGTSWSLVEAIALDLTGYASQSEVDDLQSGLSQLNSFLIDAGRYGIYITDEYGNIAFKVDETGAAIGIKGIFNLLEAPLLNVGGVLSKSIYGSPFVITDESDNILFEARKSLLPSPSIIASREHVIQNGQSLSNGIESPRYSYPQTLSAGEKFKGYGYYENPPEDPQSLTEFETLIEDGTFETPSFGLAKMFINSLEKENGFFPYDNDYKIFMTVPGQGGTSIAGLSKGTAPYTKMITQVTAAKTAYNLLNKVYKVLAMTWTQGEADGATPKETYKDLLVQYQLDMESDIKAITKQKESIPMITYQLSAFGCENIALAFLEIMQDNPEKFKLACPMYQFSYFNDDVHLYPGIESEKYGSFLGYVTKRVMKDGLQWKPLMPVNFDVQGKIIDITYDVPFEKIELDDSLVTNPGNYGFVVKSDTDAVVDILSVTVIRPNTVRLICVSDINNSFKVNYAFQNGTASKNGRTIGQRGCVRDNMGDSVIFEKERTNFKLHNYSVIFSQTLTL